MYQVVLDTPVYYRWRPFLRDPGDEFILDVAVGGDCDFIVTHNTRHFAGVERFGLRVVTPGTFLKLVEDKP